MATSDSPLDELLGDMPQSFETPRMDEEFTMGDSMFIASPPQVQLPPAPPSVLFNRSVTAPTLPTTTFSLGRLRKRFNQTPDSRKPHTASQRLPAVPQPSPLSEEPRPFDAGAVRLQRIPTALTVEALSDRLFRTDVVSMELAMSRQSEQSHRKALHTQRKAIAQKASQVDHLRGINTNQSQEIKILKDQIGELKHTVKVQNDALNRATVRYAKLTAGIANTEFPGAVHTEDITPAKPHSVESGLKIALRSLAQERDETERRYQDAVKQVMSHHQKLKKLQRELASTKVELAALKKPGAQLEAERQDGNAEIRREWGYRPVGPHYTQQPSADSAKALSDNMKRDAGVALASVLGSGGLGPLGSFGTVLGAGLVAEAIGHTSVQSGVDYNKIGAQTAEKKRPSAATFDLTTLEHTLEPQMQQLLYQMDAESNPEQAVALTTKLRQLLRLGAAVALASSVDNMFESVAAQVASITNCDRVTIWVVDAVRGELRSVAAVKSDPITVSMNEGIAGWVATHGESASVPEVTSDPRFSTSLDLMSGYTTRSTLCVPCWNAGSVVAVLQLLNKLGGGAFTELDEVMMGMTSAHLGAAVAQMIERAEDKQQIEKLRTTLDITRAATLLAFSPSAEPCDMIALVQQLEADATRVVGSSAVRMFISVNPRPATPYAKSPTSGKRGVVHRSGPEGELWFVAPDVTTRGTAMVKRYAKLRSGIVGHVATHGMGMSLWDPYSSPLYNSTVDLDTRGIGMFAVPITTRRGDVVGVLEVGKGYPLNSMQMAVQAPSQECRAKDQKMLELVQFLADQFALVLDHALLSANVLSQGLLGNPGTVHALADAVLQEYLGALNHGSQLLNKSGEKLAATRRKATLKGVNDTMTTQLLHEASEALEHATKILPVASNTDSGAALELRPLGAVAASVAGERHKSPSHYGDLQAFVTAVQDCIDAVQAADAHIQQEIASKSAKPATRASASAESKSHAPAAGGTAVPPSAQGRAEPDEGSRMTDRTGVAPAETTAVGGGSAAPESAETTAVGGGGAEHAPAETTAVGGGGAEPAPAEQPAPEAAGEHGPQQVTDEVAPAASGEDMVADQATEGGVESPDDGAVAVCEAADRSAEPADQAAERSAEQADQATETSAEPADQATETSAEPADQATETSVEPTDQAAETSAEPEDQAAHTTVAEEAGPAELDALQAENTDESTVAETAAEPAEEAAIQADQTTDVAAEPLDATTADQEELAGPAEEGTVTQQEAEAQQDAEAQFLGSWTDPATWTEHEN